jgi:hypothetical protein
MVKKKMGMELGRMAEKRRGDKKKMIKVVIIRCTKAETIPEKTMAERGMDETRKDFLRLFCPYAKMELGSPNKEPIEMAKMDILAIKVSSIPGMIA